MSRYTELMDSIDTLIEGVDDNSLRVRMRQHADRFLEDHLKFLVVLTKLDPRAAKLIVRELPLISDLEQLSDECVPDAQGKVPIRRIRGIGEVTVSEIIQVLDTVGSARSLTAAVSVAMTLEDRIIECFKNRMLAKDLQDCVNPSGDEKSEFNRIVRERYLLDFDENGHPILIEP